MEVTQLYRNLTDEEINEYKVIRDKLTANFENANIAEKLIYKGLIQAIDTTVARGTINVKSFELSNALAKKLIKENPTMAKNATDLTISNVEKVFEWVDKQQI